MRTKRLRKTKFRVPLVLVKIFNYEYWPFWLFFFPMTFYYLYLSLRARSFTYFTASNPGIEMGGVFGESKIDILNKIDKRYLPATLYFEGNSSPHEVVREIAGSGIQFPLIIKPNIGERGNQVHKVSSASELLNKLNQYPNGFIVQEFIDYEIELGVLYYRMPDNSQTGITSVVVKEFLAVEGDGKSSIFQLLHNSNRARFQLKSLGGRLGDEIYSIPQKGEKVTMEPIGNHCRGTKFINGNDLINQRLVKVFDQIAVKMDGFYFGRFDLKVRNVMDLYKGKVKIMEVNGVSSEPGHIYDPAYSLLKAYRDIAKNMKIVYRISIQNNQRSHSFTPLKDLYKAIKIHFSEAA